MPAHACICSRCAPPPCHPPNVLAHGTECTPCECTEAVGTLVMTSGDFHDLKLASEGHMLMSYGTAHRRRTEPPDDRTGSPCHLSVPWSTSIWYTRTGPRVIDAVLVNQSDCAVKMLWWRPLASSCARNVINHEKHTGNCWRRHLDSVIRHSQQAGAPRLRK